MSPPSSSANIPAEDSPDERQEVIQVQILPQVLTSQFSHTLPSICSPFSALYFLSVCNADLWLMVSVRWNQSRKYFYS